MPGDPPVFGVGCEGRITDAKRLPDGRFNILLLGTQRFRILRESAPDAGRLYRVAEIERLEDAFDSAARPRVLALRHRAIELVAEIARAGRSGPPLTPDLFRDVDDVTFVNALSNAFALAEHREAGPARGRFDPRALRAPDLDPGLPGRPAQPPRQRDLGRDPLMIGLAEKQRKILISGENR